MNNTVENNHHITFSVNDTLFALHSDSFQEIRFLRALRVAPDMPEHMVGNINIRRERIPVVDVRKKFGMTKQRRTSESCIILAEKKNGDERYLMGLLSDTLPDVIGFEPDSIEQVKEMEEPERREFVRGIGKQEDKSYIILDFDKIFSNEELLKFFSMEDESFAGNYRNKQLGEKVA